MFRNKSRNVSKMAKHFAEKVAVCQDGRGQAMLLSYLNMSCVGVDTSCTREIFFSALHVAVDDDKVVV